MTEKSNKVFGLDKDAIRIKLEIIIQATLR
jgi:hypothetical protein